MHFHSIDDDSSQVDAQLSFPSRRHAHNLREAETNILSKPGKAFLIDVICLIDFGGFDLNMSG
jgi:hypothetical protein